jgi:hypothetical protein
VWLLWRRRIHHGVVDHLSGPGTLLAVGDNPFFIPAEPAVGVCWVLAAREVEQ